eukprot:1685246-Pyramimonas_sp.AAC.1
MGHEVSVRDVPKWLRLARASATTRGLRWSSLWGHEACEGCRQKCGGRMASAAGAFGGAPYGATKRVTACRKRVRRAHASAATRGLRWSSLYMGSRTV